MDEDYVERLRELDDTSFWNDEKLGEFENGELSSQQRDYIRSTPIFLVLRSILNTAGPPPHNILDRKVFKSEMQREAIEIVYDRTPPIGIAFMRSLISPMLDLQMYKDAFFDVLVEIVTDPTAYLSFPPDLIVDEVDASDALFYLALSTKHRTGYESIEAMSYYTDLYITKLQNLIMTSTEPKMFLQGDTPTGRTVLDVYLTAEGKSQHFVPWIVSMMKHYEIPFVQWESSPDLSLHTKSDEGSTLHRLLRLHKEKERVNNPNGDFKILPIHRRNLQTVIEAMSIEERTALDSKGRTAYELAVKFHERIERINPRARQLSLEDIIQRLKPRPKRA